MIGHHFFSPANVMRLLEIVRGKATVEDVIATSMDAGEAAGKGRRAGRQLPRLRRQPHVRAIHREAHFLSRRGPAKQVDPVIYDFGMAMGPLAVGDLAGLDVGWRIRKASRPPEPPRAQRRRRSLCELGRFGQKTGAGWYRYDRQPHPRPTRGGGAIAETAKRAAASSAAR